MILRNTRSNKCWTIKHMRPSHSILCLAFALQRWPEEARGMIRFSTHLAVKQAAVRRDMCFVRNEHKNGRLLTPPTESLAFACWLCPAWTRQTWHNTEKVFLNVSGADEVAANKKRCLLPNLPLCSSKALSSPSQQLPSKDVFPSWQCT